jgi:hypothetical protein
VEDDAQSHGVPSFHDDPLAYPQTSIAMMDIERVPTKRHGREREPSQAGAVKASTAGGNEEIQA